MALDGRRRLLALQRLASEGAIGADHPVEVFEETDPLRQRAAALLTNTAVPVHVADVIGAIGRMRKARLAPEAIARALGYAELEVKRLAALSALHPKALEALKAGRINLRQARLLARLKDRQAQKAMADAALEGRGFAEWRVTDQLERGTVTAGDRRFALAGADRYVAAGGRIEADLFGERPPVLLDPEILHAAWAARAEALAAGLAAEGVRVRLIDGADLDAPEGLAPLEQTYGDGLDEAALAAWRAARSEVQARAAALGDQDLSSEAADEAVRAYLAARLAAARAGEPGRRPTAAALYPRAGVGLEVSFWGPPPDTQEGAAATGDDATGAPERGEAAPAAQRVPLAEAAAPQSEGVGHALHEVRTDLATRALIRALAEDPAAALVALTARLFAVVVLGQGAGRGGGALTVSAAPYGRDGAPAVEALDGEVRRRLAERRAAWDASGRTPIAWVAALAPEARSGLLAELVALSLDLREERTGAVRAPARAEAAEIAVLCGARASRWWTPDETFLRAHGKAQLLGMLGEMDAADARDRTLSKAELTARVAGAAAARRWTPGCVDFVETAAGAGEAAGSEDEGAAAAAGA